MKHLLEFTNLGGVGAERQLPAAPKGVISRAFAQKPLQTSRQHLPTLLPTTALKDNGFAGSSTFSHSGASDWLNISQNHRKTGPVGRAWPRPPPGQMRVDQEAAATLRRPQPVQPKRQAVHASPIYNPNLYTWGY